MSKIKKFVVAVTILDLRLTLSVIFLRIGEQDGPQKKLFLFKVLNTGVVEKKT